MTKFRKITAIAGLVIGMAFAVQPAAGAVEGAAEATPRISISKAVGLADDTTVAVRVSGFTPNSTVFVGECGDVRGVPACPEGKPLEVTTDAEGTATTSITVRRSFDGFSVDGTPLGVVDCATSTCYLLASEPVCPANPGPDPLLPITALSFTK